MPMITPPKEQSVLPDGSPSYQSNAGATPEAFGGGVAAGLAQDAGAADQIAMRQFAVKNETDVVAAQNKLMGVTQDLRNGNPDKGIVGYSTLNGQNAIDAQTDYQQKVKDSFDDIRSSLNPAAARMFDFTGMRIMRGEQDAIGAHAAQQQRVATAETMQARIALSTNAALMDADDPDAWAHHIGEIQDASGQASIAAGKYGDAAEIDRVNAVGKAYVDRTKQLMARDPMEAADFYHSNVGMVPPIQRHELEAMLKTTTDAQYLHHDATDAYHAAIGQASAPALPSTIAGSDLAPYQQKDIDRVANFVKAPSQYDDAISAAAKQYNVSPTEIKLKIGIESGGNPNAVNPKSGATGLGQFMPATATQYGITDRTDPVQSINGIAKFLAGHGGTVGSDMHAADKAYMGSGPTADQYAENTRAARQAVIGGGAPAPLTAAQLEGREGAVLQSAAAAAEARRPGDAVWADRMKAEAHANWAQDVQALRGQDYANAQQVLGAVINGKATTLTDLPPDVQQNFSKLTPHDQQGVQAQMERNVREASGEYTKSDPKLVNDLMQRIYLPDGDPQKIVNPGQLTEFMAHGLNYTDQQRLGKEIQQANTPEGSPFQKQLALVKQTGRRMLVNQTNNTGAEDLAEEAAYRFGLDVDNKVKAARAAKQDPQALFQMGSPSYVLAPSNVASFMPSPSEIMARRAKATAAPAPAAPGMFDRLFGSSNSAPPAPPAFANESEANAAVAAGKIKDGARIKIGSQMGTWHDPAPVKINGDADYNALPAGARFIAPDGDDATQASAPGRHAVARSGRLGHLAVVRVQHVDGALADEQVGRAVARVDLRCLVEQAHDLVRFLDGLADPSVEQAQARIAAKVEVRLLPEVAQLDDRSAELRIRQVDVRDLFLDVLGVVPHGEAERSRV